MQTYEGIYENGAVRLLGPVPWSNGHLDDRLQVDPSLAAALRQYRQ
jgi:hypothetical protein